MNASQKKILLHAYGNPGRGDDGLGNEFIKEIDRWIAEHKLQSIATDSNYQLNIEDAATMADYDSVVFVDASKEEIADYSFTKIQPESQSSFTTHAMSPSGVLYLCNDLYGKQPETYLLHIRGYKWEMMDGLSEQAEKNLRSAFYFFRTQLQEWIENEKKYEHV